MVLVAVFLLSAAPLFRHKGRCEVPTVTGYVSLPVTKYDRKVNRWIERDLLHRTYIDVQLRYFCSNRVVILIRSNIPCGYSEALVAHSSSTSGRQGAVLHQRQTRDPHQQGRRSAI